MGAVYFYHLTRQPLEVTLPRLVERARAQGWRVEIRSKDRARLEWLDEKLWLGPEESFFPHGLSGGPHDALQPVLLNDGPPIGADCVMCINGTAPTREEVDKAQRACVIFDGHDPEALQTARGHWKALTDAGCAAQYWSEESGAWEKKAESGG